MMSIPSRVAGYAPFLALWTAGAAEADPFVNLSALPGGGIAYKYGAADGINDSGQVTGCMSIGGLYSAFLYSGGSVYNLGPTFGSAGTTVTHGTAINASGQVGAFWGVPGKAAYYYTGGSAGKATALLLPGGTAGTAACALSVERCRRRGGLCRAFRQHGRSRRIFLPRVNVNDV